MATNIGNSLGAMPSVPTGGLQAAGGSQAAGSSSAAGGSQAAGDPQSTGQGSSGTDVKEKELAFKRAATYSKTLYITDRNMRSNKPNQPNQANQTNQAEETKQKLSEAQTAKYFKNIAKLDSDEKIAKTVLKMQIEKECNAQGKNISESELMCEIEKRYKESQGTEKSGLLKQLLNAPGGKLMALGAISSMVTNFLPLIVKYGSALIDKIKDKLGKKDGTTHSTNGRTTKSSAKSGTTHITGAKSGNKSTLHKICGQNPITSANLSNPSIYSGINSLNPYGLYNGLIGNNFRGIF